MPNISDTLPEGTDTIIAGASATDDDFTPAVALGGTGAAGGVNPGSGGNPGGGSSQGDGFRDRATSAAQTLREQAGERTADLRGQAGDKAREFAEQGKDRATEALENIARLIGDAADQVDDKVGQEYGAYARRAADAVDGLASSLRDKDVDALFADAREMVKRSPALAVSAAAVLGFALVRVVKSGLPEATPADPSDEDDGDKAARGSGAKTGGKAKKA